MQRIHNLSKWTTLGEGEVLDFINDRQRTVVIEVNAPDEVQLYVMQRRADIEADPERRRDVEAGRFRRGDASERSAAVSGVASLERDGETVTTFLATVKGRDRIEVGVDGAFGLVAVGGDVYVYSNDSQDIATRIVEPLVFTRIANRKARNPQLEMIQYQMRRNQEAMLHALEAESTRREQALMERLEQYAAPRDTGTPTRTLKPRPKSDTWASDQPTGGEAGADAEEGSGGEKLPETEDTTAAAKKRRGKADETTG